MLINTDFRGANLIAACTYYVMCIGVNFQGAEASIYGYFYMNTILPDGRFLPARIIDT